MGGAGWGMGVVATPGRTPRGMCPGITPTLPSPRWVGPEAKINIVKNGLNLETCTKNRNTIVIHKPQN